MEPFYVFVLHFPLASFTESVIGLCGGLREDNGRVGGESLEIVSQQFLESLPTANKRDEHEHTPEDAEAGQERAALVSRQRVKDFFVTVDVDSHNGLWMLAILPLGLLWVVFGRLSSQG